MGASPTHFLSLLQRQFVNSSTPSGLPMVLRGAALDLSAAAIEEVGFYFKDSSYLPDDVAAWLEVVLPKWASLAPPFRIYTAGQFLDLVRIAVQLARAAPSISLALRRELKPFEAEADQYERDFVSSNQLQPKQSGAEAKKEKRVHKMPTDRDDPPDLDGFVKTFLASRPDEKLDFDEGKSFGWQSWRVSFASTKGPAVADKTENQDAVLGRTSGQNLVFALCDGVSTSYGARYAAAHSAASFCAYLSDSITDGRNWREALQGALSDTQRGLTCLLEKLARNVDHEEWKELRSGSTLQPFLETKLCENTLRPVFGRAWSPVMATTLIGGYIQGNRAYFVRVGDGVVEVVGCDPAHVRTILTTDADEMAIDSVVCPGPKGQSSVEGAQFEETQLLTGESLVVSSDGLIRGIKGTVAEGLNLTRIWEIDAPELLRQACARSDEADTDNQAGPKLYADNLSLLYIRPSSRGGP